LSCKAWFFFYLQTPLFACWIVNKVHVLSLGDANVHWRLLCYGGVH